MKVKAKSVISRRIIEKTFRADEKVTQAIVEKSQKQFLYREGDSYVFMDLEDYSQMSIPIERISDKKNFLIEGFDIGVLMYENDILDIELPPQVKMKVTKAEPGVKGNTSSGATKKVLVETGLEIEVPLFINEEEYVMVDTRSGDYISRAE